MSVICLSCNKPFEDYKQLAIHIASSKNGHRKGRKWAASYLLKLKYLNKRDNYGRSQLSEVEKDNKKDMVRVVSGETTIVETICPRCNTKSQQVIPIEHSESNEAWKIEDCLVVRCQSCISKYS